MNLSIVAEGGGMRGAYTLGVMDALYSYFKLRKADYLAASSSGTGTLAYYASGQFYPGYHIWTRHVTNPRLISLANIARNKPILDIDYIIDDVFRKKIPLSHRKLKNSKMKLIMPLTNLKTQKAEYFSNKSSESIFEVLRAAMAVPLLYNKHIEIGGEKYFDGSFSDPVPIGIPEIKDSRKIVILASRLEDHDELNLRIEKILASLFRFKLNKTIRKNLERRYMIYKKTLKDLAELEKKGDVVIKPSKRMSRFDNRPKIIFENIKRGYDDAVSSEALIGLVDEMKKCKKQYFRA